MANLVKTRMATGCFLRSFTTASMDLSVSMDGNLNDASAGLTLDNSRKDASLHLMSTADLEQGYQKVIP